MPDRIAGRPAGGRRRDDGRGMAESVQWAMLMPLVVTCVVGIVGVCLWLAGRSAAQEAAFAGAEAAAIWDGDADQARQSALQVAEESGLEQVEIGVSIDGDTITVEVTAVVPTFLPDGVDPRVHGVATRWREPT